MLPTNRVIKLDSTALDESIFGMLGEQLKHMLSSKQLPRSLQRIQTHHSDEISLALKLLIFKLTMWNRNSSYGLTLQNLKMAHITTSKKIILLGILLGGYISRKVSSLLFSSESKHTAVFLFKKLSISISRLLDVCSLANYLHFLVSGRFPTIIYRLLGIGFSPINIHTSVGGFSSGDSISYEFQNRQLVWNTLTEFIIFIVPLITVPKSIKTMLKANQTTSDYTFYSGLQRNYCAICYENSGNLADSLITNPYMASPCNHIYCYICILERFSAQGEWNCLRCGTQVQGYLVFGGDFSISEKGKEISEIGRDPSESPNNSDTSSDSIESELEEYDEMDL